ncbi:MAG TPA: hypothetical protein PLO50_01815 [Nitrospira sp.]|nr:hypothetical protein [Nitrospira sp.]
MNVKGFILEDDQGREFVMGWERPYAQIGRTFLLHGWQRRRLIPLQYSEREARHAVGEALMALDDLFTTLRKRCHDQTITAEFAEKVPGIRKLPMKADYRYKA